MALAERVEGHDQVADIRKAENTLLIVVEDRDLRQTDRAAALLHLSRLYSKIGQPFKAEIHCKRALPLVRGSEHGWLKDLRKSAKVSLKVDTGPELRLNIEELLKAGNESRKGPWRYINRQLEVDLKRPTARANPAPGDTEAKRWRIQTRNGTRPHPSHVVHLEERSRAQAFLPISEGSERECLLKGAEALF